MLKLKHDINTGTLVLFLPCEYLFFIFHPQKPKCLTNEQQKGKQNSNDETANVILFKQLLIIVACHLRSWK